MKGYRLVPIENYPTRYAASEYPCTWCLLGTGPKTRAGRKHELAVYAAPAPTHKHVVISRHAGQYAVELTDTFQGYGNTVFAPSLDAAINAANVFLKLPLVQISATALAAAKRLGGLDGQERFVCEMLLGEEAGYPTVEAR